MAYKIPPVKPHMGEWWFTDDAGRKIGWMFPEDFEAACENIWGRLKWVRGFAKYANLNRATVDNYRHGLKPIPKHMALLITLTENHYIKNIQKRNDIKIIDVDADWLPALEDRVMNIDRLPWDGNDI